MNGPSAYTLFDIAYDGSGLYAMSGDSGRAPTILISTDAVTWEQRTPQPNNGEGLYGIGFAAGECQLEASQPGDNTYLPAAPVSQSILQITAPGPGLPVNPGLVFNAQDSELFVSGGTFILSPPASTSQTPVDPQPTIVYVSNTPSVCTIPLLGSIEVTMLAVGICTITAASAPTGNYLPGGPIADAIEILSIASIAPPRPVPTLPLPLIALLALLTALIGTRHRRA